MKKLVMVLGIGTMLSAAGFAAAEGHPVDPKLPKEVQNMHCLIGNWEGTASFQTGDTKAALGVSWACKRAALGYGVACLARFSGMPGGAHEESDLFGFDADARKYHWFAVSSSGEAHDHVAEISNGTLRFVYEGVSDGQPLKETILLSLDEKATHLEVKSESSVAGKTVMTLTGSATKR
jgi:hypothetical protein